MANNDLQINASDFVQAVEAFFGADSPLRKLNEMGTQTYEHRPQQAEMAKQVAESFMAEKHLVVEAPTGIGKSFAYLIPAIYYAKLTKRPVVIATHTISLQEQLISTDIPLLEQLVDFSFSSVLAKGRDNYVCRQRLHNVKHFHQDYLPSDDLMPELERIIQWSQHTQEGTLTTLPFKPTPAIWSSVCSEAGVCAYDSDNDTTHCFFRKARNRLYNASIVVTNHALFCVDLAKRRESNNENSILPDYSAAIIDEAHCFEDVAVTHLGMQVSNIGLYFLLHRLFHPKNNRGLLTLSKTDTARNLVINLLETAYRFFNLIADWLLRDNKNPRVYQHPDLIPNTLSPLWVMLELEIQELSKNQMFSPDLQSEIDSIMLRLRKLRENLEAFLDHQLNECVYWIEMKENSGRNIYLNVSPLEVNAILNKTLFSTGKSIVLTSATLAYHGKFDYFCRRLGITHANSLILDSPFDYRAAVDLYIPFSSMPSPNEGDRFISAAIEQIKKFIIQTEGKAFVLFTNYTMMNQMAVTMKDFFSLNRIKLMVQGHELQRSQMLKIFKEDIHSVIFGTDSFWMGVDVPGEALSNVIIVKLPFLVPTHPLVAARKLSIEKNGGNPFRDYFLPEAVMKFRQGIGRLIRTQKDHGIIVVLDSRIIRTNYGKMFLQAIPDCRRFIF